MKLQFEYQQQPYLIDIDRNDQIYSIKVGDRTYTAEVLTANEHFLRLKIDNKSHRVYFAEDDELFISVNGRDYILEKSAKQQKRGTGVKVSSAQDLTAPMPGKVLKVLVGNGEQVEEGQALLILEAMKMEYTIKALQTGKVIALSLQEGDQVDRGQVLLDIEPVG